MAGTAAIISAVAAVGAGVSQNRAASAQNKAQKRSAAIERAQAGLENTRRIRRAIAARRLQEAEFLQAGATQGVASSGIAGAVGSLRTQTAANAGAANTQLAAATGQSLINQRGATRAARFGSLANTFGSISQASGTLAQSDAARKRLNQFFGRGNG